jgi:hypothetical protein
MCLIHTMYEREEEVLWSLARNSSSLLKEKTTTPNSNSNISQSSTLSFIAFHFLFTLSSRFWPHHPHSIRVFEHFGLSEISGLTVLSINLDVSSRKVPRQLLAKISNTGQRTSVDDVEEMEQRHVQAPAYRTEWASSRHFFWRLLPS